jgi:DNA-directed RNA polymerase III subunit RPC4
VKRESGTAGAGSGRVPEFAFIEGVKENATDGGYISSDLDEPDEGQHRPIETMNLLTDDEEEGMGASDFPIRLNRVEHRDRALQVNPDAGEGIVVKTEDVDVEMTDAPAPARQKGKQREKSVEIIEERPWRGVWADPDESAVKEEPNTEEPAARARGKSKEETEGGELRTRRARHTGSKTPALFNEEERNEYLRELEDNQVMLEEFGDLNSHKEDTRMYLFQFPPVLPNLSVQKPVVIKDDPDAPQHLPTTATTSSTNQGAPIKIEEDDPMDKKQVPQDQRIRPEHLPKLASGAVGKLRVHKSGKVTMNWGGSSFVVQNGVTPKFLQSLVMVKIDEQAPANTAIPSAMTGVATAFGQPRGKLIVQPDWDEMLEGGGKGVKVE